MECCKCGAPIAQARSCGWRICQGCYKAAQRGHYVQNGEARLQYQRNYIAKHPEQIKLKNRAYYLAHKEDFFAMARNREALKRATGPVERLTAEQWAEVLEYFDHRCAYCLERGDMTMDHVIALSRGGLHTMENVVPACSECNQKKWARPVFFMAKAA